MGLIELLELVEYRDGVGRIGMELVESVGEVEWAELFEQAWCIGRAGTVSIKRALKRIMKPLQEATTSLKPKKADYTAATRSGGVSKTIRRR